VAPADAPAESSPPHDGLAAASLCDRSNPVRDTLLSIRKTIHDRAPCGVSGVDSRSFSRQSIVERPSLEPMIVQAADAISAARPDILESYVKSRGNRQPRAAAAD
jgi:hypothetical protein